MFTAFFGAWQRRKGPVKKGNSRSSAQGLSCRFGGVECYVLNVRLATEGSGFTVAPWVLPRPSIRSKTVILWFETAPNTNLFTDFQLLLGNPKPSTLNRIAESKLI